MKCFQVNSKMYQVDFFCIFLIKTLISGYDSFESNLTTATIQQNTSTEPTISHREINHEVERSTTSDMIMSTDTRRIKGKTTKTSAWPWDVWCILQPREGECDKQITRYFYNLQLDRCEDFFYTGCHGNENSFENIAECNNTCKGTNFMNVIESPSLTNYCYIQPDPGLCLAMTQKYYYDINDKSCNKFTYGGCGGNQNKFDTMFQCLKTCNPVVRNN